MKSGQDTKPSGPGPEDALLHGGSEAPTPQAHPEVRLTEDTGGNGSTVNSS